MEREVTEWTENLNPIELKWLDHCLYDPSMADWWQATVQHPLDPWQVEILCPVLEEWAILPNVNILFHAPPQFGKSEGTSERAPAYAIGCDPSVRVWEICHNVTHAAEFGEQVRNLMCTETFQRMFPRAAEAAVDPRASAESYSTWARKQLITSHPSFQAAGLKTGVVGKGPEKIMEDDPYASPDEAMSKAINNRVDNTHKKGIRPRLRPFTSWFMMFHRYQPDDAIGRILARQWGFRYLRCPAVADKNEDGSDPTTCCHLSERWKWESGQRKWFRMGAYEEDKGDLLAERHDRKHIEAIQKEDPETYAGQYQGRPKPPGGEFIKREWLRETDRAPASDLWVRFFDLAVGKKQTSDFHAGALMTTDAKQWLYLTDMLWFRQQWGDAQDVIYATILADARWCQLIGARYYVGVEEVYWQDAMIQDLLKWIAKGIGEINGETAEDAQLRKSIQVMPTKPVGDKKIRASAWVARAKRGMFYMVAGAWDMQGYVEEAIAFDGLELTHDDQMDATSGATSLLFEMKGVDPDTKSGAEPDEDDTNGIIRRLTELARGNGAEPAD